MGWAVPPGWMWNPNQKTWADPPFIPDPNYDPKNPEGVQPAPTPEILDAPELDFGDDEDELPEDPAKDQLSSPKVTIRVKGQGSAKSSYDNSQAANLPDEAPDYVFGTRRLGPTGFFTIGGRRPSQGGQGSVGAGYGSVMSEDQTGAGSEATGGYPSTGGDSSQNYGADSGAGYGGQGYSQVWGASYGGIGKDAFLTAQTLPRYASGFDPYFLQLPMNADIFGQMPTNYW